MWAIFINENSAQIVSSPDGHGDAVVYPYREIESTLPDNKLGPFTYRIQDNEVVGERTVIVRSLESVQTEKTQKINEKAKELLDKTDWYIIRWKETGAEAPQDVIDYRTSIRSTCNTKEQEILSTTSVDDVAAFDVDSITWPVDPTIPVIDPATKV